MRRNCDEPQADPPTPPIRGLQIDCEHRSAHPATVREPAIPFAFPTETSLSGGPASAPLRCRRSIGELDRREDREPAVAVERLPRRRRSRWHGVLIDGNDDLGPLLERAERRRDRDHPHPRHPPPPRPRRRPGRSARAARRGADGRPRRGGGGNRRGGLPDHRRRREAHHRGPGDRSDPHPRAREPATSPSSSTAPTSSPPTSSSRARSAARWRRAPAASTTSAPR